MGELSQISDARIDELSSSLNELSLKIWKKPELGFQETFAHGLLTKTLKDHGFDVQPQFTLDTAFKAVYEKEAGNDCKKGLTAGIICEYDALPNIGHACGHNLIAEAGIAAALGVQAALRVADADIGQVIVFGTPAEEGQGGKIKMINNGCFDEVDFIMMVHPNPYDAAFPTYIACAKVTVIYKGHEAHASGGPWEGINALDAAVMAYNGISTMRQQMKPTWRVHGIITEGGTAFNVIPSRTKLEFGGRAPTMAELKEVKMKMTSVFQAAALATGCEVEIEWNPLAYKNLVTNSILADIYQKNAAELGVPYLPRTQQAMKPGGSTDMGNVSQVKPAIHPRYYVADVVTHTPEFQVAAGTGEAHQKTLIAAKSMARTCLHVMCNPGLMDEINSEFQKSVALHGGDFE